jgi:hypothetical protein
MQHQCYNIWPNWTILTCRKQGHSEFILILVQKMLLSIIGTKKIIRETGDMPQKVFFGAFWTHSRQVDDAPCQIFFSKIIFLSPPWVAVLKL